jgi:hypothetical protein
MKHLKLKVTLTAAIGLFLIWLVCSSMNDCTDKAVPDEGNVRLTPLISDINIIRTAAERNGIVYQSENWFILLAINKAEGNVPDREFGIMNPKANDLDSQAGWCAASIVKGRQRWIDAGKPEDFITHFGRRYCPPEDHELNKNWAGNVKFWAKKLRGAKP